MKKLLSMLAVSTLVGTSASSLKPLCISNVSQGFKSNHSNKNISIQGENATNPFISKINDINTNEIVSCSVVAPDGTIYVGTYIVINQLSISTLYRSTDGIKFIKVNGWDQNNGAVLSLVIDKNGTVYVGTDNDTVYKSKNSLNSFIVMTGTDGWIEHLVINSNGKIYAGSGFGLYKSINGTDFEKVDIKEVKSSVHR